MTPSTQIRRLGADDAEILIGLRAEALQNEPLAFASSPEDERALSVEFAREYLGDRDNQAVYGAFDAQQLVGIVGLHLEPKIKRRHIAHIWGVYVTPSARQRGIARSLMLAAIEHARQWPGVELIELGAATNTPAPIHLYESLGFRTWGVEIKAVKWNGVYADDAQMVLEL